ncbi:hypothetical protein N0V93_009800 [Gnomoniopsis smithogilvyi]|uniref:Glycosyltransferase 2-like domain-containing protein n=1 Tax=Gnomoniopsis smithogilvyi TaxID=1191159 RepID=A0A9W8YL73_9PEZI|nr:hypothetical protein N0V93_009800 [Gnomoniopsis smithogilvyi]
MFYNLPSNDPLYQANNFDWYAKRLIFDLAGNGWNYGSGWIMRRKTVDDIGGFPEDIVTEDVSSSAMAMAEGWKTIYLQEGLQYGLVPETYVAYIKQMTRWHVGESQTATKFGFYHSKEKTKYMKPLQKWVQTAQGLNVHIRTPLTVLNLVFLSLAFLTDMPLVHWKDKEEMRFLLRIDCAIVLLRWLHELHYAILAGYRSTLNETCKAIYLSPYCFMSYVRTFIIPKNLGGKPVTFTPTGSIGNQFRERDPHRRAPRWQRLRHIIADGAWFHLAVVILFLTSVFLRIGRAVSLHVLVPSGTPDWEGFWMRIIQNVAWPSNPWLVSTLACMTPLQYALFPPTTPDREKLLGKRDENGVRYPLETVRGKTKRSKLTLGYVETYTLYMIFVLAMFFVV